jgi:hypothetical protein
MGLGLTILFLGLWSCTEVGVNYPGTVSVPGSETEREVVITPTPLAALQSGMPLGTKYYFYDAQSGKPVGFGDKVAVFEANRDGSFSGKLPFGTYCVLAVNVTARGAEFRGLDENFETASAYLEALASEDPADASRRLVNQAEDVYVLVIDNLVVQEGTDAIRYFVTPRLLTRTVVLNLDLSRVTDEVMAVSGSLNGVFPAIGLSSQQPVTTGAATTAVRFGYSSRARAVPALYPVSLHCFGLLNPEPAASGGSLPASPLYKSELRLTLTASAGGSPLSFTVDATRAIAKGFSLSGSGDSPIFVEVVVSPDDQDNPDVPGDPKPTLPGVGVDRWKDGGRALEVVLE